MEQINISKLGQTEIIAKPGGFLGSSFNLYLEVTRSVGLRYDANRKAQVGQVTKLDSLLTALGEKGFQVNLDPAHWATTETPLTDTLKDTPGDEWSSESLLETFGTDLYPYQCAGVEWLTQRDRALLADEMGLGKTAQALVALPPNVPVLVVAPASVKLNWVKEASRWRPDFRSEIINGKKAFRFPEPGEIVVVTYDSLPKAEKVSGKGYLLPSETGSPASFTHLIFDEIHKAKNSKSLRAKAARALVKAAIYSGGKAWALTGTPLVNKPNELWTILSVIGLAEKAYRSWLNFMSIFGGQRNRFGIEWTGDIKADQAIEGLRRVSLRRTADDHLDLPEVMRQALPVAIDKKTNKLCDELVKQMGGPDKLDEALALAIASRQGATFELLSAVRAALATSKTKALVDLVDDMEEQDEPLIVFSCHRAPLLALTQREGWAQITGSESAETRQAVVEAFQAGKLKGVAISILAGAEGITLTRAHRAIFVDRWWNPAINAQAEARIRRIGQDASHIQIIDLVASHAIDQRLHELLLTKGELINQTVDASAVRIRSSERAKLVWLKAHPSHLRQL